MICPQCSTAAPDEHTICFECGCSLISREVAPAIDTDWDVLSGLPAEERVRPRLAPLLAVIDIFAFPFRGAGLFIVVIPPLAYFLLKWMSIIAIYTFPLSVYTLEGLLAFVVIGYMSLTYLEIIRDSSYGKTTPDWPDFNGLADIGEGAVIIAMFLCVGFGPTVLVYSQYTGGRYIAVAAVAWSVFYAPAALAILAKGNNIMTLSPFVVIRGLAKDPLRSSIVCLVSAAAFLPGLNMVFPLGLHILDLPENINRIAAPFVLSYTMVAICRILGLYCFSSLNKRNIYK